MHGLYGAKCYACESSPWCRPKCGIFHIFFDGFPEHEDCRFADSRLDCKVSSVFPV